MRMILATLAVLGLIGFGAAEAQDAADSAQESDTWETFVQNIEQRVVAEFGEEGVRVWVQESLSWDTVPELSVPMSTEPSLDITREFPVDMTQDHYLSMSYIFPAIPQIFKYSGKILRIVVPVGISEAARRVWDWIFGADGPEPPPGTQINIETNNGTIVIATEEDFSWHTGN